MGDGTKTYLVWTQKDHLADEVSGHGEQSLEETETESAVKKWLQELQSEWQQ